jgi:hypothetical protein
MSELAENPADKRFLADVMLRIVHDTSREISERCGGRMLKEDFCEVFEPDTLETAMAEGYDVCVVCVSGVDPDLWMELVGTDEEDEPPPPSMTWSPLSPPPPLLSAGDAVSMEDEPDKEGQAT